MGAVYYSRCAMGAVYYSRCAMGAVYYSRCAMGAVYYSRCAMGAVNRETSVKGCPQKCGISLPDLKSLTLTCGNSHPLI